MVASWLAANKPRRTCGSTIVRCRYLFFRVSRLTQVLVRDRAGASAKQSASNGERSQEGLGCLFWASATQSCTAQAR